MDKLEEVKPLQGGDPAEVFSDAAQIKCVGYPGHDCDALIVKDNPNRKRCPDCATGYLESDAFRKAALARTNKSRAKKADKKKQAEYVYDSKVEPNESEAIQILEDRGIRTGHVANVVYELAMVASESLGLTPNRFYFANGVEHTLASYTAKVAKPLPEIEDAWYPGERTRVRDLHALWDFGTSWREQSDGNLISFLEFRRLRRLCMTDTYEFGRQILGKDLHPEPHGRWAKELFVQKNPDLLPEIYDQEDLKQALAGQSEIHQRLLISSRNSYKSTYNLIDLLSWVLCFGGDIRIFMISATKKLSAGFLKSFRDYWTVKNPKSPTLFNQLFPEYMIRPGEGSATSFVSPMRQLDLIQPTLTSASMSSEGLAGERADLICSEDSAEISNSSSPEMREKTLEFFDSVLHLLEPSGFLQVVGTPFAPGDIYSTLLERESKRDEKQMLHQINPCWAVKEGVNKSPYDVTLTEDEVMLLFPSRLTFRWLMNKLRDGEKEFRQQYLCSWVPDIEDELTITFLESDLRLHTKPLSYFASFQTIENILVVDPSFTTGRWADPSAIVNIRMARQGLKPVAIVTDCLLERLKVSDLAGRIVDSVMRNRPNRMLIERAGNWESLADAIQKTARLRHVLLPYIYWKPTTGGGVIQNKARRIKGLEPHVENSELWFVQSPIWNEQLFAQFAFFDGGPYKRSSQVRKDDGPDACALAMEWAFPRDVEESERTAAQKEAEKAAREDAQRRAIQQMIFGAEVIRRPVEPLQEEPDNPLFRGTGAALKRKA
jgi:hypothetical protein